MMATRLNGKVKIIKRKEMNIKTPVQTVVRAPEGGNSSAIGPLSSGKKKSLATASVTIPHRSTYSHVRSICFTTVYERCSFLFGYHFFGHYA